MVNDNILALKFQGIYNLVKQGKFSPKLFVAEHWALSWSTVAIPVMS